MSRSEGPRLYAVVRADPKAGEKVKYRSFKERLEVHRYHGILDSIRLHGADRMDADIAARWCRDRAKAGDRKVVEPGILIEIEEEQDGGNV